MVQKNKLNKLDILNIKLLILEPRHNINTLARRYGVHHTTIAYHLGRLGRCKKI